MSPLTEKENKSYKQELCYTCNNKFNSDLKIHWKVRDHYHGCCTSYMQSKI